MAPVHPHPLGDPRSFKAQMNKVAAKRQERIDRKIEHMKFVKDVLKKWDKSHSGTLTWDELKAWLSSIQPRGDVAKGNMRLTEQLQRYKKPEIVEGNEPSDEEIKWVMSMAQSEGEFVRKKDFANVQIKQKNFSKALESWLGYIEEKAVIDETLQKFDTDSSGNLDKDQLRLLLTDLNEGIEVPDSEAEWVLKHADVIGDGKINGPELTQAISLWYLWQDAEEEKKAREQVHAEAEAKRSKCCTIS